MGAPGDLWRLLEAPEATGEEENVKRMKKSADSTPGGGTLTLQAQIMAELAQAHAAKHFSWVLAHGIIQRRLQQLV